MKAVDLISQARRLARASHGRPRQVDLKRAVSSAYYAMFHALARECADTVVGTARGRNTAAWSQTYRALEHGATKNACRQARNRGASQPILAFADAFIVIQEERHSADYDPLSSYTRQEVNSLVSDAAQPIAPLRRASRHDRRAFVAMVLLREPRR